MQTKRLCVCVCVVRAYACVWAKNFMCSQLEWYKTVKKSQVAHPYKNETRLLPSSCPVMFQLSPFLIYICTYRYIQVDRCVCMCACGLHSNNIKAQSIRLSIHECYGFMFVVLSLNDRKKMLLSRYYI